MAVRVASPLWWFAFAAWGISLLNLLRRWKPRAGRLVSVLYFSAILRNSFSYNTINLIYNKNTYFN